LFDLNVERELKVVKEENQLLEERLTKSTATIEELTKRLDLEKEVNTHHEQTQRELEVFSQFQSCLKIDRHALYVTNISSTDSAEYDCRTIEARANGSFCEGTSLGSHRKQHNSSLLQLKEKEVLEENARLKQELLEIQSNTNNLQDSEKQTEGTLVELQKLQQEYQLERKLRFEAEVLLY